MKKNLSRFAFCLIAGLAAFHVQAQEKTIAFDGVSYKKVSEDLKSAIQVVEYIPKTETASDWEHKLAFRHYPHLDDARAAGAALDASLKQDPTNTIEQSIARRDGNEALVSYLRWPQGTDHMEYHIIRYTKKEGIKGLVTYQFTYRFKPMETPGAADQIAKERQRWQDALVGSNWPMPSAFSK